MLYTKPTHRLFPTLLIGEPVRPLFTYLSSRSTNFCMIHTLSMVTTRNAVANSDEKLQDLPVLPNHLYVHEKFSSNRLHFSHVVDTCWLTRNWMQGEMDWRSVAETIWRASHRKRGGLRRGHERQCLLHFATETVKLALGLDNWYLQEMYAGEFKPTLIMFRDEASFHLTGHG
jgi:hypothetical protein